MSLAVNLRTAASATQRFTQTVSQSVSPVSRLRTATSQGAAAFKNMSSGTTALNTSVGKLRGSLQQSGTTLAKSKSSTDKFKSSLDKLKASSGKTKNALRDVKRQADAVEKSVGKAGKNADRGGKSMGSLGKGLKGASLAQRGLNLAMAANPFGLVMALLAPLISQFINMDKISAALAKGVKWAWNAILGAIKSHAGPIKSILKGIINAFTALPRAYISGINFMIGALNRVKVSIPGWVPVIGGKTFQINIPKIPNIPTLAQGGIVPARTGGTLAVVGEGGEPEAVIPLSKLDHMIGSGGGLRRLATAVERLADRPVIVQVDSQTIARAVFLGQRQLARR